MSDYITVVNPYTGELTLVYSDSNVSKNSDNIMTNAFRIAVNGSLSRFNMIDCVVDEFEDETGINTTSSTNESYDSADDYYHPYSASVSVSPYAHYKLNDDAANTTVTDDGTGANNGTCDVNTSTISATGKINECFDFNENTIQINSVVSGVASDTTGTVAMWFESQSGVDKYLLGFGNSSTNMFGIKFGDSGIKKVTCFTYPASAWSWTSGSVLSDGWHHFAVVQNGTAPKFYIDGVEDTTALNVSSNPSAWCDDSSDALDTTFIGARAFSGGADTKFTGMIDDIRYYQNLTLSATNISAIYNYGSGTEADKPALSTLNMTLISEQTVAEASPNNARMVILEEDVNPITLNTDIKVYASNDDGSNWHQGTLSDEGDYDTNKRILVADFDISAQSSTDMVYKIETLNNKDCKIHATGLSWD